jgi:hypothetical protein
MMTLSHCHSLSRARPRDGQGHSRPVPGGSLALGQSLLRDDAALADRDLTESQHRGLAGTGTTVTPVGSRPGGPARPGQTKRQASTGQTA